jgi:hypothetical protein
VLGRHIGGGGDGVGYVTVFDASHKGLDWTAPMFGALFVFVAVHTLRTKRRTPPYDKALVWRVITVLFLLFGLAIGTVVPVLHWRDRNDLVAALESGRATVVEGEVRDFVPMPWGGHAMECFTVEGTRFCYSDFVITAGFNNARSHGGPIREGLHVRIHYVDCTIARLEVAKEQGS